MGGNQYDTKTLGQISYEAYYSYSKGKSLVSGEPLPSWDKQIGEIKRAWEAAGFASNNAPKEASKKLDDAIEAAILESSKT